MEVTGRQICVKICYMALKFNIRSQILTKHFIYTQIAVDFFRKCGIMNFRMRRVRTCLSGEFFYLHRDTKGEVVHDHHTKETH